jgi:RNA polymerase sigma factor (sigma-70 family)
MDGHDLVVRTVREHAPALMRTARRHSLCQDDAHDAYQRALEIFLRRAATLEPDSAVRWLHVVVKNEARAVRQARLQLVGSEEADLDARATVADGEADAEERALRFDRLSRSAEALARLKPQELTALWLKAQGLSYTEIAERQRWTYTKVNRCLTEGRRAFLERYAGIEAGDECRRWAPVVSALVGGEATAEQLAAARPHLRRCSACRATVREQRIARRPRRMAGLLPGLAATVHERLAAWATKLQLVGEAASAPKLAAVAASAAALVGGGAAVHELHEQPRPARSARLGAAAATGPAASRSAALRAAPAAVAPATAPAAAKRGGRTTATRAEFPRRVEFAAGVRPPRATAEFRAAPPPDDGSPAKSLRIRTTSAPAARAAAATPEFRSGGPEFAGG